MLYWYILPIWGRGAQGGAGRGPAPFQKPAASAGSLPFESIVDVKEVLRWVVTGPLSKLLGVPVEASSPLMVVLTASHFEIVGFNAFAWSRAFGKQATQLWDWSKHPDLMGHVWNATIHAQKEQEI